MNSNTLKPNIQHQRCEKCGAFFISKNKNQKFCSSSCAAKERENRTTLKNCKNCKKQFEAKIRQVYCTNKCKDQFYQKNKLHTLKCKHCNGDFKTNNNKQKYCSVNCSVAGTSLKEKSIREKNFEKKFNQKFLDFKYIDGYKHSDKDVRIKCLECNEILIRNARVVRGKGKIKCEFCAPNSAKIKRVEREKRELKRRAEKRRERNFYKKKRELQKELNKIKNLLNREMHDKRCPSCLKEFITFRKNRVYCSELCKKREQYRRKELARRMRIKRNGVPDNDITLMKVYEKDNGFCYLCGDKTDETLHYNDEKYPTIEHVIPLSKGGTHTWDNVRLACRKCNNFKNDRLLV